VQHETNEPIEAALAGSAAGRCAPRRAAVALLALLAADWARAQEPFDSGPSDGLFSLPRSQDDIAEWQEARRDVADRRFEAAVERLHRLLRADSRGAVPVLGTPDRWTGIRRATVQTLRDLPPEGIDAYERLCRREAGRLYELPLTELSPDQLAFLARSFPTAARGLEAQLRLGDLALVAGDGIRAQARYRAALDAVRADGERAASIRDRLRVADLLARATVGPVAAGDELTAAALVALPTFGEVGWSAYGGGYDGSRRMDPPIGEPGDPYRLPIRADGFEMNPFAMHLGGDLRAVFVNDGHSVRAVDPIQRGLVWEAPGPMVDSEDVTEAREAINTDIVLGTALSDDLVIAPLQVPNEVIGANQTLRFRDVISIVQKIPSRRLFAFDRATGKRVWAHWDFEGGPTSARFQGHEVCGPPLVHGDAVYVPTHDPTGAIAFYASAYDLETGALRWRRLICSSQQEVNMFGNARSEFASSGLAVKDGVLYGTTNLGLCYALDVDDGDVRWLSAYPVIPLPRTQLRDQERRPVFFANNPLVIADGVLATTPLDSEFAIGLDAATGEMLWRVAYDPRPDVLMRWLLGAVDGEFVFAGLGLVGIEARPEPGAGPEVRVIASPEALGEDHYRSTAIPRGALAGDRIWFVGSDGGIRILDSRGNRDPRMARSAIGGRGTGNLLLSDGIVAAVVDGQLQTFADVEALVRDARGRANAAGASPAAVLRLAMLLRARGVDDPVALEDLFARGLKAAAARGLGPGTPVHRQLSDGLFGLTMDRADATADPESARRLLETARERATSGRQWLRAQQALLARSESDPARYLAELERLAVRFPDERMLFPEVGRVPAGVYAAWRAIDGIADPAQAALACQRLMERHGDEAFGPRTVGDAARARLAALIERHGEEVLAAVETEARRALDAAGDDPAALQSLARRYPLTRAAREGTTRLLDLALARGSFASFASTFAEVQGALQDDGALRRLIAAALQGGNPELARSLAGRLLERAAQTRSDFAPDQGRTYAAALADLPGAPPAVRVAPAVPVREVARLTPPNAQTSYLYWAVRSAPGFPAPDALPLFVSPTDDELLVFALTEPFDPNAPLASVSIRGAIDPPILVCGRVAVIVDAEQVFGLDLETGEKTWTIPGSRPGSLSVIGVADGLLQVHAPGGSGDGGSGDVLLAVEPLTGAVLSSEPLRGDGVPATPVLDAGLVWTLDARDPARPVIRAHDPLGGRIAETTPIPADALAFLGLDGADARRLNDPTLRGALFADRERVYLPVDLARPDQASRLVALARGSGEIAWTFGGLGGCSIQRAGGREGRIAVFEKGSSVARLSILDARTGAVEAAFDFGQMAAVRNWDRFPHPEPAPPVVLVTDVRGTVRLTAVSIAPDGPRVEPRLDNVARILRDPLVGEGYLLVPFSRPNLAPTVQVLDSRSLQGALPNGEKALRLDLPQHASFQAHGRHLVIKTLDLILVMTR
jgi:outer membrane protein assembly factor BamB